MYIQIYQNKCIHYLLRVFMGLIRRSQQLRVATFDIAQNTFISMSIPNWVIDGLAPFENLCAQVR